MIHHFILTRFFLNLWRKDKNEQTIDQEKWLERRFELFENYCLPSIERQTVKDFEWILLVSSTSSERVDRLLKDKLSLYKGRCPQIKVVKVKKEFSWRFADVFRDVVRNRLAERGAKSNDLCLTTYFDNDDMLHPGYLAKVQAISSKVRVDTFIVFDYGIQYFEELGKATRIYYPNNHFMTLVEDCSDVKTCYGYGSHFLIEKNHTAGVSHIKGKAELMWVEVIHEGNVDNDVKMTWDTSVLASDDMRPYSINVNGGWSIGLLRRSLHQVVRRTRDKIIPRKW